MAIPRQRGAALLLALLAIVLALASVGALALTAAGAAAGRERATNRALAQARDALIAFAADRPIDARVGPGYLPCPDLDDDGWAEPTCGSLSGHLGQAERLGRMPWKTLGLPDLRDGDGERLWYAVSSRHKGLLNCAASRECIEMTPEGALGTISVRDASATLLQDGTLADPAAAARGGAAAVVIAPGAPLVRRDGHVQRRDCAPGECDARGRCLTDPPSLARRCDPRNYLDAAPFEDNADFVDRSDLAGRAANANGFVQGPVVADGATLVNDRIAVLAYPDVMGRVMARVGLEIAHCVRIEAAGGAAPEPIAACDSGPHFGRIDDAAWPPGPACNAGTGDPSWWLAWRPFVRYARAGPSGMEVVDERGLRVAAGRRFAVLVTRRRDDCAARALECDAAGCTRIAQPARSRERQDALVASP
jgi:hypothetical protein